VAWEKGQSGNPDGRPRGSKNKFTHLRDEFLAAFEEIGGRKALVQWAQSNPDMFYKLVVQMLPKERTVDMTTHKMTLEDVLVDLDYGSEIQKFSTNFDKPINNDPVEAGS